MLTQSLTDLYISCSSSYKSLRNVELQIALRTPLEIAIDLILRQLMASSELHISPPRPCRKLLIGRLTIFCIPPRYALIAPPCSLRRHSVTSKTSGLFHGEALDATLCSKMLVRGLPVNHSVCPANVE